MRAHALACGSGVCVGCLSASQSSSFRNKPKLKRGSVQNIHVLREDTGLCSEYVGFFSKYTPCFVNLHLVGGRVRLLLIKCLERVAAECQGLFSEYTSLFRIHLSLWNTLLFSEYTCLFRIHLSL